MNDQLKIRGVKYNLLMNIILKLSSLIFPLITLPYVTRTLGSVANGKIAFATSIVNYFSMFAQLGIPTYGIRTCATCRDDKEQLTKTVHELMIINSISVFVTYILFIIAIIEVPRFRQDRILLVVNAASILLNMLGMEWLYQAVEQYRYITIRNIGFKCISIIAMFMFVHKPSDYVIYSILIVISSGGSNILNLWNARKIINSKSHYKRYNLKKHLHPIVIFFMLSVAISLYTSMDTVMLGFLSSDREVAYYSLATKVKMVLATTISALGPVLLPRITYCLNNGQQEKFVNYIRKSFHFVLLISIPLTIYFVSMANETVELLGGSEYKDATSCMRIITLAIIPLGIGNIVCSQILTPLGKEKLTMYSTIYGAIINLTMNAIFIPKLGALGAAVATVLAESVVTCVQMRYVWNEIKEIVFQLKYWKFIIAVFLAFIVMEVLKKIILVNNIFLLFVITAVLFFGIYFIILCFLKEELILQYGKPIMYKIKNNIKKS